MRFVDFLRTIGPKTFKDIDELEGFTATILGPSELGVASIKQGKQGCADDN